MGGRKSKHQTCACGHIGDNGHNKIEKYDAKIVLLSSSEVGKSSIATKYTNG